MDSRLQGCMAALCGFLALMTSAAPAAANERPDAAFDYFPSSPVEGQTVRFTSAACDPDGAVYDQEWDLDGDGVFDDAFGRQAARVFPAGPHKVALRVTPLEGAPVVRTVTIGVDSGPPIIETFSPPPLNPFPVVRIVGQLTNRGARIDFLSVKAPVCTRVTTICRGASCPFKRNTRLLGWNGGRVRPLSGARLRAGVTIEVLVTKRDRIGKYTKFTIRRDKPPKRMDRCLRFAETKPASCL